MYFDLQPTILLHVTISISSLPFSFFHLKLNYFHQWKVRAYLNIMGWTKSGRSTLLPRRVAEVPGLGVDDLCLFKIQAITVESFPLPSYKVLMSKIVLFCRVVQFCARSVCGAVLVHTSFWRLLSLKLQSGCVPNVWPPLMGMWWSAPTTGPLKSF